MASSANAISEDTCTSSTSSLGQERLVDNSTPLSTPRHPKTQEDYVVNLKSPTVSISNESPTCTCRVLCDTDGGPSTSSSSDKLLQHLELLAENVHPRDAPLSPARASLSIEKSLHMYYSMKRTETFSNLYDFDCSSSTTSSSSEKLLQRLEELSENIPPGSFLTSPDHSSIGKSLPLLRRTDDSCATYDFDGSSSASSTTSEKVSKCLEQLPENIRSRVSPGSRLSPGRSLCPVLSVEKSKSLKRSAPSPLKPLNRLGPRLKRRSVGTSRWDYSIGDKMNQVSSSSGVVYIYSQQLMRLCDTLLKVPKRVSVIHVVTLWETFYHLKSFLDNSTS